MRTLLTLGLLLPGVALAQAPGSFVLNGPPVLEPNPLITYMSESIANPSVAYDTIRDRYLMVFEARTPTVNAACPQGVWALGYATSPDGLVWTPSNIPLLNPTPGSGTYHECVAAHPNVIFNPAANGGNGRLVVWFKGEEDNSICGGTGSCDQQYTGVGRMRVNYNLAGNITSTTVKATPVLDSGDANFGYPHVVQNNGTFYMLFGRYPDILVATGATTGLFVADPIPALELAEYAGTIPWVEDELFNPATVCEDNIIFPFSAFVGGRNTNFGAVINGGWGSGISSTGLSWVLGIDPFFEWSDDLSWRHWDVLRANNDYLVWYDQKDGSGNNSIYFASTTTTWNNADVYSKSCP
jgi:hypothetical protein